MKRFFDPMALVIIPVLLILFPSQICFSQTEPNYDESRVPNFFLPDPLKSLADGSKISNPQTWEKYQRPALLKLLEKEMYGHFPGNDLSIQFILDDATRINQDSAIRKEIIIQIKGNNHEVEVRLLLFLPTWKKLVPVFLGYNFYGNHTVSNDPAITIHQSWAPNQQEWGIINHRVNEKSRGVRESRWPISYLLSQGYGIATMYYGEVDPDFDDGFNNGIHQFLDNPVKSELSSLSAWAWMLSRAMDYLVKDPDVNPKQITVFGHSRLGKAALWAGANDSRFAMVISNNSGCGGAALSRRKFGETVNRINHSFPHWFNDQFNTYNNAEEQLPFDQHSLLSLIAPRPLYVASAEEDLWADPRGEFLSAKEASPVYQLYDLPNLHNASMPATNSPLIERQVGYHIRTGKHDITLYDWTQFVQFAKHHFDN